MSIIEKAAGRIGQQRDGKSADLTATPATVTPQAAAAPVAAPAPGGGPVTSAT